MPQDAIEPPSDDRRWKLVAATMRKHGMSRFALIETLHQVQESFGYLDEAALRYVAASLRVPLSTVQGVATFYHHFTLKPKGRHTCVVCTGTACFIKGADPLLAAVRTEHGLAPGETTADGAVSLLTARCLGACSMAPAAVYDGEVQGEQTTEQVTARIRGWRDE